MKNTILKEHIELIIDAVKEGRINEDNFEDLHSEVFNSDHFIIGNYRAKQWLASHDVDPFDAIDFVQSFEIEHFGETTTPVDPETIVNMLSYIVGIDAVDELGADSYQELLAACLKY